MKINITALCIFTLHMSAIAQSNAELTISQCQRLARENYPLINQHQLIDKSQMYSVSNAIKGYLPQISVLGQASYQSEVTKIPIDIPGISHVNKDQYRVYGEISQLVYDGGMIKNQRQIIEAEANVQHSSVEVSLYKIENQINEIFFGIIVLDRKADQNRLLQEDLKLGLTKTEALISSGLSFRSNADMVKAELLKAKQVEIEIAQAKKAYQDMLAYFIGKNPAELGQLVLPAEPEVLQDIGRPELAYFDRQRKYLESQKNIISSRNLPKLNLFIQSGYGRPTLNLLNNEFGSYYIGGARLSWNISSMYTSKKEKLLIDLHTAQLSNEKAAFVFTTTVEAKQNDAEIMKYRKLLESDLEIIRLRHNIKTASIAQLENGVITTNDYMRELHAEDQAIQSKILNEVQLLKAIYRNNNIKGRPVN